MGIWSELAAKLSANVTMEELVSTVAVNHGFPKVLNAVDQLRSMEFLSGDLDEPAVLNSRYHKSFIINLISLMDSIVGQVVESTADCPVYRVIAIPARDDGPYGGWIGAAGSSPVRIDAITACLAEAAERASLNAYYEERQNGAPQNTVGCAAGVDLDDAFTRAFLELVERDAVALWWYNRLSRTGLDVSSFEDPFLLDITRWLGDRGRTLSLLDLTTDLGIPVVAALSWNKSGQRIAFGFGARLTYRAAARRAVCEMISAWIDVENLINTPCQHNLSPKNMAALDWLTTSSIEDEPYVVPSVARPVQELELPDTSAKQYFLTIARDRQLEVQCLDLTRPQLGITVVKLVAPGLLRTRPPPEAPRLHHLPTIMRWKAPRSFERPQRELFF